MKTILALSMACILCVSACTEAPQEQAGSQAPAATPPATVTGSYRCESGATVTATYPSTDSALVEYQSTIYRMHIAVSGSGARYVGGGLEWWTKGSGTGSEGTLFHHLADGTTGERIEFCTEL